MNRKIDLQRINELLEKYYPKSVDKTAKGVRELATKLGDLTNTLHNAKIQGKEWERYFEPLILKIVFHSLSISTIAEGQEISSKQLKGSVKIIDISSTYILTRALLETFLTLEYIYMSDIPEEEKYFRFKLWEISGLLTRQSFDPGIHPDMQQKKEEEAKEIEDIRKQIEADPFYSELNKNQKWKLNNYGLPRINSWNDLIEESRLATEFTSSTYKLFSNYAHSEFLSILQLKQSNVNINNEHAKTSAILALTIAKQVSAVVIKLLVQSYKSAEITYNTHNKDLRDLIEMWNRNATNQI